MTMVAIHQCFLRDHPARNNNNDGEELCDGSDGSLNLATMVKTVKEEEAKVNMQQ